MKVVGSPLAPSKQRRASGSFAELNLMRRVSLMGRQLPTADVGYLVAQLGGPLSEGEIARPTGACRPISNVRGSELVAPKRPVEPVRGSLRLLLGAQPKLVTPMLQVVHRVITRMRTYAPTRGP